MQDRRHTRPTPRQSQRNASQRSTNRSSSRTTYSSRVYAPKPYAASEPLAHASRRASASTPRTPAARGASARASSTARTQTPTRRASTPRRTAPASRRSSGFEQARPAPRSRGTRPDDRHLRQPQKRRHFFPAIVFASLIALGIAIVVAFTNPWIDAGSFVENVAGESTDQTAQSASPVLASTSSEDDSWPITGEVSLAVDRSSYLYANPYQWSDLVWNGDGNYAYQVTAGSGITYTLSREGVDVSEHNGTIDWNKVRADGIDYAIVRIGVHGTSKDAIVTDDNYSRNLVAAREAGLGVGVYFYSQATTTDEAVTEANFVLEQLSGTSLDYPVFFDFEPVEGDRAYGLTIQQRTDIAEAFCSTIEDAGYTAAIYCSSSDLTNMYNLDRLAQYGFWMAQYVSQPTTDVAFGMWQYTNQGTVDGISGYVDLNIDLTPALQAAEGEIDLS